MPLRLAVPGACFCLAFCSCATTWGNKEIMDTEKVSALTANPACTKSTVYAAFGQPADVLADRGDSVWAYLARVAKSDALGYVYVMGASTLLGGKDGDVYTRTFRFAPDGRLISSRGSEQRLHTSNLMSLGRTIGVALSKDASHARVAKEMEAIGQPFDPSVADDYQKLRDAMK